MGIISIYYDWNWEAGGQELKQALQLNPNSGWDHYFYALFLQNTNRFDEAIAEVKRALELDPFNVYLNTQMGETYLIARQFEEAIDSYEKAILFSGGVPPTVSRLACALYETGEKEVAEKKIKSLEQRLETEYVSPFVYVFPNRRI